MSFPGFGSANQSGFGIQSGRPAEDRRGAEPMNVASEYPNGAMPHLLVDVNPDYVFLDPKWRRNDPPNLGLKTRSEITRLRAFEDRMWRFTSSENPNPVWGAIAAHMMLGQYVDAYLFAFNAMPPDCKKVFYSAYLGDGIFVKDIAELGTVVMPGQLEHPFVRMPPVDKHKGDAGWHVVRSEIYQLMISYMRGLVHYHPEETVPMQAFCTLMIRTMHALLINAVDWGNDDNYGKPGDVSWAFSREWLVSEAIGWHVFADEDKNHIRAPGATPRPAYGAKPMGATESAPPA